MVGVTSVALGEIEECQVLELRYAANVSQTEVVIELQKSPEASTRGQGGQPVRPVNLDHTGAKSLEAEAYSAGALRKYHLAIRSLQSEVGNAYFMEHVFDVKKQKTTSNVILGSDKRVFVSRDLGQHWTSHDLSLDANGPPVVRCFSLLDGNRLLQTKDPGSLYLVDSEWCQLAKPTTSERNWHGTWSIDSDQSSLRWATSGGRTH